MLNEPPDVVAGFMLGSLERIGSEVKKGRQAQLDHGLLPDAEAFSLLLHEYSLPLLVAKAGKIAVVRPVEKFAALIDALAGKKVALVVTVEVDLEVLATGIVAHQQLCLDIGLAGRCDQRRRPVLCRKDVVDLAPRRQKPRPAHQRRDPIAAFPIGVLLALEWRSPAIGP